MKKDNKIILHPNTEQTLIDKSLQAIDQEDFDEALTYIDQLLDYGLASIELHIGKIVCLIQTGQQKDAILFCESIMEDTSDEHFFDYLFYYVTLLFEANEYAKLIHYIDELEASMDITEAERASYEEIYHLCVQMNERRAIDLWDTFLDHIQTQRHQQAWISFHDWATCRVATPSRLLDLLAEPHVHPVIKTELLLYLKETNKQVRVTITKFAEQQIIETTMLKEMKEHVLYKNTIEMLAPLQQENPTQYEATRLLFDRFIFVYYPFYFPKEDIEIVIQALTTIQEEHLLFDLTEDKTTNPYVQKIQQAMNMYIELVL